MKVRIFIDFREKLQRDIRHSLELKGLISSKIVRHSRRELG